MASKPKVTAKTRLVCSLPNAGTMISGIAFATVTLRGQRLHVSEHFTDDMMPQADRLLSMDGYDIWDGEKDEDTKTIEDALTASRSGPGTPTSALASYERQLKERDSSIRNQAGRIKELSDENRSLSEQIEKLTAEIAALKAGAAAAAAPAPSAVTNV